MSLLVRQTERGAIRRSQRTERRIAYLASFLLLTVMQMGPLVGLDMFKLLGVAMGLTVFFIAVRRPMANAKFLVVWLPLSPVILAAAYGVLHVPQPVVKNATYLRFMLVLALLFAGARKRMAAKTPLEPLDRLAVVYLSIVTVYSALASYFAGFNLTIQARMLGLQSLGLFIMVFIAIRWLDLDDDQRDALLRRATQVLLLVGLLGLYQRFDPGGFRTLILDNLHLRSYYVDVTELRGSALTDQLGWFYHEPIRVSSVVLAPFEFADMMLAGAALGFSRLARAFTPANTLLTVVCAVGVFTSGTRINLVALGVVIVVAALARSSNELARVRFLALAAVGAVAALPLVLSSRLLAGDSGSNDGHMAELTASFNAVVTNPIGSGVGNEGAIVRRLSNQLRVLPSGNTVLGVGLQIGLVGMLVLVAFLVTLLLRTREGQSHLRPADLHLSRLIIAGGLIAGLTHNAWTGPSSGPFAWLLIALGSSTLATRASDADVGARRGPELARSYPAPMAAADRARPIGLEVAASRSRRAAPVDRAGIGGLDHEPFGEHAGATPAATGPEKGVRST